MAKSVDTLIAAAILGRSQNPNHEARLYVFTPTHLQEWVQQVGSTAIAFGRIKKNDLTVIDRVLDNIERSIEAQVRVIDDLRDISRIVTGRLCIEMTATDLSPLIRETLETIRPTAEAKRITLEHDTESSVMVWADRARLQQVLWNLLSNAVKFTPARTSSCQYPAYGEFHGSDNYQ